MTAIKMYLVIDGDNTSEIFPWAGFSPDHVALWPQGQLLQGPNSTCEDTGSLGLVWCWPYAE